MERQNILLAYKISQRVVAVLFGLMLLCQSAAAAEKIVLVSLPENGSHKKFSKAFRKRVAQLTPSIDIVETTIDAWRPIPDSLTVTLGSRAFKEITQQPGRMFHTLVSHTAYEEIYPDDGAGKYHMVFNQPLEQMLLLHSIVLPDSHNVGLLLSNPDYDLANKLSRHGEKFGKNIVLEKAGSNISESLSNLLPRVDSLLLLPDARVVNRSTINSLVLDSYHKKIPILGYSKSLVRAGAMVSIYSTAEQLGEDAAQLVVDILSGSRLPIHNYPTQFEISVNYKLSRAFGISIPSEDELHKLIMAGGDK